MTPTLICTSKYGLITTESAALWSKIPNSRLVHFERSGHLLPWTEAKKFNAELTTFATSVLDD
jgi:pimeloyl-ACP methyl ester carboxylesterase